MVNQGWDTYGVPPTRMADGAERRGIHAMVSPEAYAGWADFSYRHRVSLTGLLDALGLMFAELAASDEPLTDQRLVAAIALAQELDAERRSRRR